MVEAESGFVFCLTSPLRERLTSTQKCGLKRQDKTHGFGPSDNSVCPSSALRAPSPRLRGEEDAAKFSHSIKNHVEDELNELKKVFAALFLLPASGEKVPEGRMRGSQVNLP